MKKYLILSVILFSATFKIQAQETIDLNEAISSAIRNNTSVSNLEKSLQIQRLTTSTARGNLFPDLSLSASWFRNNTFSEGTVRFVNGVPTIIPKQDSWINSFNVGANASVVIFNGLANYEEVTLSEANEVSVRINLEKEKYDIAFRVVTAYFDVLKKEKIVAQNEENLADSRRQLESITEYRNVGKRTLADVYRQDSLYVPQNCPYVPQNSSYVPQNCPYVPQNSSYVPQNSSYVPQNCPHVPQNSSYVPQNSLYVPQNSSYVPQNSSYVPQNCPYVPQNCSYVPQNSLYVPQNCSYVPQNCLYVQQMIQICKNLTKFFFNMYQVIRFNEGRRILSEGRIE